MAELNPNSRLEAFCDAVFAIALTLLIIDLKIPPGASITSNAELWLALTHIVPSIFAFLLSFGIILITWVNHHNGMKLVNKSCNSFIYANGLLLLSVVLIPFPTSLVGEYVLTDHASPAVTLYNAVLVVQSTGWIVVCTTALRNRLGKNETANVEIRANAKYGYIAFTVYSLFAVIAFWFPLTIAIVTTISWILWLIVGINIKHN